MEQIIQKTEQNRRTGYLDALRIVSTFAVMILHLSAAGHKTAETGSSVQAICWGYDFLSRFAVPVFVMISGAIFLNPDKEVNLKLLLKKNIPRLVLAFFAWSAVYALMQSARECAMFSAEFFLSVIRKTVTGHYHMWYLYMIVGLYLAVPFLRPIAADRKLLKQFILLSFLLGSVPRLLYLIPAAGEVVREVTEKADISFFAGYAGYFCLGYYLHSTQFPKRRVTAIAVLAAVLMTAMTVLGVKERHSEVLLLEKMPHIFVYSTAVFLVFKENADWFERSATLRKWIGKLAFCSFGMYLAHPAFNFVLNKLGIHALTFTPLLCVPLCGVLVFIFSYFLIRIMKKCPLLKRFV